MKVLIRQFLGKNHSWKFCGQEWARGLKQLGHQVDLFSTDGIEHLPTDLKENLIGYVEENNHQKIFGRLPDPNYDCQISYTAMKNFPHYLSSGTKNRFGIWASEWKGQNVIPLGFAKNYKYCDMMFPPSNFAKEVLMQSGVPNNVMQVIPHGINVDSFRNGKRIDLPTNKKFKILANIAQNHLRKNIPGLLAAYGKAFNKNDDVCLILKAKDRQVKFPFEVSLKDCLKDFDKQFPQHAEIKIFSQFVDDIADLYYSVDAIFTMTHCEGYYIPGVEALAAGKLNIAPLYGGQLDFLNDDNSLLIGGKEVRANPRSIYWEPKNYAIWFQPDINEAAEKLRYAYNNYEKLNEGLDKQREKIYTTYNWKNIVSQFLSFCK